MLDFLGPWRSGSWAMSLGVIVLFLFLIAFAGLGISEVVWLSAAVAALFLAFTVHALLLRRSLRAAGGRDERMRVLNSLRERRGF
jgi:Mn2+/Fe2+ NRAMP family transporter